VDRDFSNGQFINPYNVYGDCPIEIIPIKAGLRYTPLTVQEYLFKPHLREDAEIPPCADAIGLYNITYDAKFKKAFHITSASPNWNICVNFNYTIDARGSYYLYPALIKSGLRIWKFSGDVFSYITIY
jgi:serine carboxypeptidase-like clade 2